VSAGAAAVPVAIHCPLPPEDAARGDFYALLGRLLHAAPDQALLRQIAAAPAIPADGDAALARAWQGLRDASSVMDADAAAEEYETLFEGMGKSELSIYAGYFGCAPEIDHPRVRIQADLAALGLARPATVTEPEDHFAALFDVMRVLVAGGAGRAPAALAEQRRFFDAYLRHGVGKFFAAVGGSPKANYYRHVAAAGGRPAASPARRSRSQPRTVCTSTARSAARSTPSTRAERRRGWAARSRCSIRRSTPSGAHCAKGALRQGRQSASTA
jgi:TorA maturation chaperone TorD